MCPRRTARWAKACAAVLLLGVAGCGGPTDGLDQRALASALPSTSELPGKGWSLVGTTRIPPTSTGRIDVIGRSIGAATTSSSACERALEVMDAVEPDPTRFTRSVFRRSDGDADRDRHLVVTIETTSVAPDRAQRIATVTTACTEPLRTRAGVQTVRMTVRPQSYATPDATGYSVSYDTDGLPEIFDYVVVTQGRDLASASVSGPDGKANRMLLQSVLSTVTARLEAARQT